jgi:hypothetical protein
MFPFIWIVSIIATVVVAGQKNLGAGGFFVLSLFTGPIAFIIACVMPAKTATPTAPPYSTADEGTPTLPYIASQITDLKAIIARCQSRIINLEIALNTHFGIGKAEKPAEEPVPSAFQVVTEEKAEEPTFIPTPYTPPAKPVYAAASIETEAPKPQPRADFELSLGKDWLNKIGVLVLGLGVTFLIGYTFKYFGPWLKILTGFALGGLLFFGGYKLEKNEKLKNFGRVLLGGAWAIVYLTTYAMYHFEASRVITSQALDLVLLGVVAVGMIWHALKYKSEELVCVALGVAYLTSTIDQLSWFSVASCFLLAFTGLFLVQRFQWVKTLVTGMLFTYGISVIWGPHFTPEASDIQKFTLLTGYWAIFLAGIHLLKAAKDEQIGKILSAANFGNIAIYSVLSYPLIFSLFNGHQAAIAFAEGLIYLFLAFVSREYGKPKLYVSDLVAGIFAITFAIYLKFLPTTTLVLWLIEIPFLLFIGIKFKEVIYRFFAYALTLVAAARFFFHWFGISGGMPDVVIAGFNWPWYGFMSFLAAISLGLCFVFTRHAHKENLLSQIEKGIDHIFSAAAGATFTLFLWSVVPSHWISLAWYVEGLALILISLLMGLGRFRAYAYAVFAVASLYYLFGMWELPTAANLGVIVGNTLLPVLAYYLVKNLKKARNLPNLFEGENQVLFGAAGIVLAVSTFQHAANDWMGLLMSGVGLFFVLTGLLGKERIERLGGFILLAIGEVCFFIHSEGLRQDQRFLIITLNALLPTITYYVAKYLKKSRELPDAFESENQVLFAAAGLVLAVSAFRFLEPNWISLTLGVLGVLFILIGFAGQEKVERTGGLVLLGVTLLRVVFYDLAGLPIIFKIITFIILGVLFIGVSYIYNRFTLKK